MIGAPRPTARAAHRREGEERADRLRAARDARRVAEHVGPAAEPERGRRGGLGVGVAAEARAEERGREAGAADHDRVGAARGDAEDLLRDELGLDDRAGAEREAAPRVDGLAGGADLRRRDGVLDAVDVKGGLDRGRSGEPDGGGAEGRGRSEEGKCAHDCLGLRGVPACGRALCATCKR